MKTLLFVFLGGGIGSVLRFIVSSFGQKLWTINSFPLGTLLVNILGCFMIGVFTSLLKDNPQLKFLLITGFCGGFTTFSTFSSENIHLWQSGQIFIAIIYIALSLILGFMAVYLGLQIIKH